MSIQYRLLALVVVGLLLSPARAETISGVDLLGVEDFPGARVLFDRRQKSGDYTLALGVFKRSRNQWVIERERRLKGKLIRKTLELPSDYSAREGYDFYLEQLKGFTPRQLFYCSGRECGSSTRWANAHFDVIQLHGLDQYQYYGVYELTSGQQETYYATLYAVQRGNRRVYLQFDLVKPETDDREEIASNPETLAQVLRQQGYYLFPGLKVSGTERESEVELSSIHLESLVNLLKENPDLQLALVGHDYASTDLDQQRKMSLRYAQALKSALVEKGIKADRLEVFGLGSLAPAGRGERSARVEVVLR